MLWCPLLYPLRYRIAAPSSLNGQADAMCVGTVCQSNILRLTAASDKTSRSAVARRAVSDANVGHSGHVNAVSNESPSKPSPLRRLWLWTL
jgi:hypothetical protein